MILRELFEAKAKSVGIIFGRFNPPHMGHMKAWEMASENSTWYVGTNKSTQGPKDPLPFDIKIKAMEAVYPEIKGHIVAEQSWLTLASKVYEKHGNIVLNVYTDEDWVTKALVQYNGKEGAHGYYEFGTIQQQATPRLSSATALRAAVAADDRDLFGQAAGVDPNTLVAGHPFFDVVKHYLMPHAEKAAAKVVKKKVKEPVAELSSELLGRYKKAAGADAKKSDADGDYARGNKRFSGIVKATNKQFDNDAKGVEEGEGNFAGDTTVNIGGETVRRLDVGDMVTYFGRKAKIEDQSKNRRYSRITILSDFGGITKDVLTSDLKRVYQGVAEGWKDVVAGGAMALGALGAGAQTMPDINVQQVELANKYYNVLVQRAKEDGIKLDTRTLNVIKAKAQDAAAKKTQQSTPQQGFPSQGSERRVSKDASKFESEGVAEGSETITELRDKMYQYIKSIVPTWPDYVVRDWLYKGRGKNKNYNVNSDVKGEILEMIADAGLSPNTNPWQLVPNMKFTMDMFEPMTKQRLIGRAGGTSDMGMGIPKDKERHATQSQLAQQQGGVRKEPVLLIKSANGYELLEGWHRTIQHFHKFPDGYTGPAYVAAAQGQQGVAENAWDRLQREKALESAGVGIITKQNTTVDVNKNTPKKNLKAFRLI